MKLRGTIFIFIAILLVLITSCKTDNSMATEPVTEQIVTTISNSPKGLNPIINLTGYERLVESLLHLPLADYNPKTLEFEPILINDLPDPKDVNEGEYKGKVRYDLTIIDQAIWEDSTQITGEDYLFTLKTIFHNGTNAQKYRAYFSGLYDCVIGENPKQISVYLDNRSIADIELVSSIPLLPKHIYDADGVLDEISLIDLKNTETYNESMSKFADDFNSVKYSREMTNGSGRYYLKEWVDNQYIILKRKENHFFNESTSPLKVAYADELVFMIVPDETAGLTKLKSGSVDVFPNINFQDMEAMKNDETYSDQFNFESVKIPRYYYIAMNTRKPALSEAKVRKALAYLMDVDTIISAYENGLAERINSPFMNIQSFSKLKDIDFDRAKADSLLKEAGWEDSNNNDILDKNINGELVELELSFATTGSQLGELLIGVFKQMAAPSGVKINVETIDRANYLKKIKSHDFDITSSVKGLSLAPYDPYSLLHTDSRDPGEGNVFNFGNEESDRLIELIRSTTDEETRKQAYLDLEKILYEEQPIIFLYSPMMNVAYKSNVEGVFSEKQPGFALNTFKRVDHTSVFED